MKTISLEALYDMHDQGLTRTEMAKRLGVCKHTVAKYLRTFGIVTKKCVTPEMTFLDNVLIGVWPTSCWYWLGSTDRGYGIFSGSGRNKIYAHRFAYELFVGPIKKGNHCHHRCENPLCCNPSHLVQLTPDQHRKAHKKTHCLRGHEFTPENTYYPTCGDRICRTCNNERVAAYRKRKRLAG